MIKRWAIERSPQASLPHARTPSLCLLIELFMNAGIHAQWHAHCSLSSPTMTHSLPAAVWPQDSEWVSLLSQPHSPVCFVFQDACLSADLQYLTVGLSSLSDPCAFLLVYIFSLSIFHSHTKYTLRGRLSDHQIVSQNPYALKWLMFVLYFFLFYKTIVVFTLWYTQHTQVTTVNLSYIIERELNWMEKRRGTWGR